MSDEVQVDALLEREPKNIEALVRKAELRETVGDDRAAHAFFQAALRAAGAASPLPESLRPAVVRAQAGVARGTDYFRRYLEQSLVSRLAIVRRAFRNRSN